MKKKEQINDDEKPRVTVKLNDEEHERFKILSNEESRSMTNFATVLIRRYIREAWEKRLKNPPV